MFKCELVYVHKVKGSKGISGRFPISEKGVAMVLEVPFIKDIPSFCDGFFEGALSAKGLHINNVAFQPADDLSVVEEVGEPLYVFEIHHPRKDPYHEIHIFCDTVQKTRSKGFKIISK